LHSGVTFNDYDHLYLCWYVDVWISDVIALIIPQLNSVHTELLFLNLKSSWKIKILTVWKRVGTLSNFKTDLFVLDDHCVEILKTLWTLNYEFL